MIINIVIIFFLANLVFNAIVKQDITMIILSSSFLMLFIYSIYDDKKE